MTKMKFLSRLAMAMACLLAFACSNDDNDEPIPVPELTVDNIVGAWFNSDDNYYFVFDDDMAGKIVDVDEESVSETSFKWNLSDGKITLKSGRETAVFVITRCSGSKLTLMDDDETFTLIRIKRSDVPADNNDSSSDGNGYKTDGEDGYVRPAAVVDMGFPADDGGKLFWSSCNLGAQSPMDRGDYFVWGKTSVKNPGVFGTEISGTAYDFARVKLGGKWRMPTWNEFKQLLDPDNCRIVESIEGGRWFVKFISKHNNNVLFFPLPGYMYDGNRQGDNTYGRYLSGTAGAKSSKCKMIWMSKFGPEGIEEFANSWGYSVRPVYSE